MGSSSAPSRTTARASSAWPAFRERWRNSGAECRRLWQDVASAIQRVRAFDKKESVFVEFPAAECGFAYRAAASTPQTAGATS